MTKGKWLRESKNGLNVIFIHGINSSDECWRHENGTFWPDLLKDKKELADVGIYLFSYRTGIDTGLYSLGNVVDSLRDYFELDNLFSSSGIVFVCHSMGGIIARRFLVNQQVELASKGLNKIGLFLVASPSLGSEYANMLSVVSSIKSHTQLKALEFSQKNVWLNDLDRDFIDLKERGNLQIEGKELIEDLPIILKGLFTKQVVEPFSGAKYFGKSSKIGASDHITIAKPANKDEEQHRLLIKFIQDFIGKFFRKIDYTKLESLLSEQKWEDADYETKNKMLEVSKRQQYGWLDFNSIKNFPGEDIRIIDRLWVKYSSGHFGFSEQIKIYLAKINYAGEFEQSKWKELGNYVGWRQDGAWLKYSQIIFQNDENTPAGHLPVWVNKVSPGGVSFVGGGEGWWISFLAHAHNCLKS